MSNLLKIPEPVERSLEQLNQLVEKHPIYLPVGEVAEFMGMDHDGLRRSIETGNCPFGIGWQKGLTGNRAFKIPTTTFYLWYTNGIGFRK